MPTARRRRPKDKPAKASAKPAAFEPAAVRVLRASEVDSLRQYAELHLRCVEDPALLPTLMTLWHEAPSLTMVRRRFGLPAFEWSWVSYSFRVTKSPADRLLKAALTDTPTLDRWLKALAGRRPSRADVLEHVISRAAGLATKPLWMDVEDEVVFVLHAYLHRALADGRLPELEALLSPTAWAVVTSVSHSRKGASTLARHVVASVLGCAESTVRRTLNTLRDAGRRRAEGDPPAPRRTLAALVDEHIANARALPLRRIP